MSNKDFDFPHKKISNLFKLINDDDDDNNPFEPNSKDNRINNPQNDISYRSMSNSVIIHNRPSISTLVDKQNNIKIENSSLDFVSIDEEHVIKPLDKQYDDVCSICSRPIYFNKFICCTCSNCIICSQCESDHLHPLIKCKGSQLSSLPEVFSFIKSHQMKHIKKPTLFANFFKKETKYEFCLSVLSSSFSMRKNHKLSIPVNVENILNTSFDKENDLMLIARNNKDLRIDEIRINYSFNPKEQMEINVKIESSDYCKLYNFVLELYSSRVNIEGNKLKITIDVVDNKEEDDINDFFDEYPKILILMKEQKEMIMKVMENNISKEHPYIIMTQFQNNDWDYDKTVKVLLQNSKDFASNDHDKDANDGTIINFI